MKYDLVFRGGLLIDAGGSRQADLAIQEGKIAAIGEDLAGRETRDAAGLYLIPGGIDPHVHLDMPAGKTTSSDNWQSGTQAAVCGGTTTVIDFIEPEAGQSLPDAWVERKSQAEKESMLDFGLHMTLTPDHLACLDELPDLVGAGLPSYKLYTTYDGFKLDDFQFLQVMEAVGRVGGMVLVHCESDAMVAYATRKQVEAGEMGPSSHPLSRPPQAEAEAVQRVLALADLANVPVYIVHISTRGGAEAVARSAAAGQKVYGETCPQYLVLDAGLYAEPDFQAAKYVCSPPLRPTTHQRALWMALEKDRLDAIGTDHCPFFFTGQKELGRDDFRHIPGGLPGIQSRLELIHTFGVGTGRLTLNQWIAVCCSNPARIFGLHPRKGSLRPGADADLVVFDPEKEKTIDHNDLIENVDYSPYQGLQLKGSVVEAYLKGELAAREGAIVQNLRGSFLERWTDEEDV